MKQEVEIEVEFSEQAELLIEKTDSDPEDVIDFLIDAGGFTVGGSEVIAYLENQED